MCDVSYILFVFVFVERRGRDILFTMFQECEYEISQKGELVAKLENKTREISQMLNNLNKITAPAVPQPVKRKTEQKPSAKVTSPPPAQSDDTTEAKKDVAGESSANQ